MKYLSLALGERCNRVEKRTSCITWNPDHLTMCSFWAICWPLLCFSLYPRIQGFRVHAIVMLYLLGNFFLPICTPAWSKTPPPVLWRPGGWGSTKTARRPACYICHISTAFYFPHEIITFFIFPSFPFSDPPWLRLFILVLYWYHLNTEFSLMLTWYLPAVILTLS